MNPPKYRCPRCSTRTCSLPCSRRHKLWSQCSGVRDPAAYVRRNELATEAAFDRDFNFITSVERGLERAERDAENRGIPLDCEIKTDEADTGMKRKRPNNWLVKGEAGFLRGAKTAGVRVVRAPRGMTRNKENTSKWNPKHKCLAWAVEWIDSQGGKMIRNSIETSSIAEAYDRANPRPREERITLGQKLQQGPKDTKPEDPQLPEQTTSNSATSLPNGKDPSETPSRTEEAHLNENGNSTTSISPDAERGQASIDGLTMDNATAVVSPHRGVYFYLHRPQTSTKQPVVVPLPPNMSLTAALRNRTVLEFPTIYVLPDSPGTLLAEKETPNFILEEKYLGSGIAGEEFIPGQTANGAGTTEQDSHGDQDRESESGPEQDPINLENVDERKILEVLEQDLSQNAAAGDTA